MIDKKLLRRVRLSGICAWCKKRFQEIDPCHIMTRGAGRVDIKENIVPLCRIDHSAQGSSQGPSIEWMLEWSAKKHKTTPEAIREKVWAIRRDKSVKVKVIS